MLAQTMFILLPSNSPFMRVLRRQIDWLLRLQGVGSRARRVAVGFWLFNPFTATISSRGSGEALVTVMLLHMLLCLFRGAPEGPPCARKNALCTVSG